jgi:hypothetical protein
MALYFVSVDAIALTAATAKSVFELGSSATDRCKVKEWWVEFDGTTATNTPVKVEIGRFSAAVTTASSATASKYDPADGTVGATAKTNTTTEGAGTASDVWIHRIPPTSGMYVQYPLGQELVMAVSSFFRIRCTAAQGVSVACGVTWEE